VLIDEIGPMELLSSLSQAMIWRLLNSDTRLLATIVKRPHPFTNKVKRLTGITLIEVSAAKPDGIARNAGGRIRTCPIISSS
jgi:nucleoside-triphosphatase THEP1